MKMKGILAALLPCLALSALAAARVVVPQLPEATADAEVSTNFPLTVNAARLERLTFSVAFEPSETNEVLVALGADTDGNSSIKALWIDKLEFSRVSSGAVR